MFTFELAGKEYSVKYKIKALLYYENISGHKFEVNTMMDSVILFYSFILANNPEFKLNPDEFFDALDENPSLLTKFNLWLAEEQTRQNRMSGADEDDSKSKKKVVSHSKSSTK